MPHGHGFIAATTMQSAGSVTAPCARARWTRRSSSGIRRPSRTGRVNSGSSSMNSTPPCGSIYLSPMKPKPKNLQHDAPGYAVYTRLSVDRDGAQTATKRQEDDARKLATDRGWTVSDVYSDVDLSAFDKRVRRPGF